MGMLGLAVGFVVGVLVGAYLFFPMGGWWSLLGVASPIIGMLVGFRLFIEAGPRLRG